MTGVRADAAVAASARPTARPVLLWIAFVLVLLLLGALDLYGPGFPLGDVTSVYPFWVDQALVADYWVGIDTRWVYPIVALVPMLAARSGYALVALFPQLAPATLDGSLYAHTWIALVAALHLVAFAVLVGRGDRRARVVAGWWWTGFLLALGPIALGRIDSVTVPLAVIAVLAIGRHPRPAAALLTVAAWIKVWPGALVVTMLAAGRDRSRVLLTAAAVSAGIVALALSFGSGANVLSFVTEQTGRGLQVEAPVSTVFLWLASGPGSTTRVYFDDAILTWQVTGPGTATASSLMTPLLLLAVAGITLLGVLLQRRGTRPDALLPWLALALVTALIAFQKVGSPQFISWLAVPVVLGIVANRSTPGIRFALPAGLVIAIGALTQAMYPYLYGYLIALYPAMLVVLSVRNALLVVLLGVAIRGMLGAARADRERVHAPERMAAAHRA